jgi:hypothetical protein
MSMHARVFRQLLIGAIAVSAGFVSGAQLSAQSKPQVREGFWITVGAGGGTFGCDDCDDREGGATAQIALGGTLSQRLQLGASINAWSKEEDGVTFTQSGVMALVKFYPSATGGFFVQAGLGIGRLEASSGRITVSEDGGSAILGLGYDWRVARNFSITPFLNGVAGSFDGNGANFNQLGISLTWH